MASVLLATHPRFGDHDTGPGHPERPARLDAVLDGLHQAELDEAVIRFDPRPARRDELEAVHPAAHLDRLEAFGRAGGGHVDADTRMGSESWEVALLAAGAGVDAVERLQRGEADAAFCAVRPPGHHASAERSMGFCLVNNVAIAAAQLADRGERVLVVDIDAHHGNGTQDVFWTDPRVLYVSFHQHPLYPGTGAAGEVGGPGAEGTTVNFPFPPGATGDIYRAGIDGVLAPVIESFVPTWLLLSAGFDAHRRDPITDLGLTAGDYADVIGDLLAFVPAGRRVVFLEGGYDLEALAACGAATVGALLDEDVRPEAPTAHGPGHEALAGVAIVQRRVAAEGPNVIPERLQPVLEAVAPVVERFTAADRRIYLVGGVVRDLLFGRDLTDLDLTTDARPDEIKALLGSVTDTVWTQGQAGERFGTIGARLATADGTDGVDDAGWTVEVTTHRADVYLPESRKPEVTFADDVEADLARRDFTVNAMALALPEPRLIDPYDGAADLAAGRLRTPLAPEESFSDDPLRMMRAARFLAGYGLTPSDELVEAVVSMGDRLAIVSAERIRDELDKLLVVDDPAAGLWFLVDTGLAEEFLPELPAMRLEQDPIHQHKDVLAHTIAVVANTAPDRLVRLAALLHDIGKPKTRSYGPNGVMFHHHEVVGARMARDRMTALRYAKDDIEVVTGLVRLHLRFHGYGEGDGWTDSAVRRFVRDAGDQLERLIELTRCDCTTRNRRKAERLARRMDDLERRIADLAAQEELKAIRPDLDGRQVMDHLGIEPGRAVGEALAMLLELRLDEGPLAEAEAYARLDAWWADRA